MDAINTEPLISIIIPTYNRGWCIKRAINSLINQTYKNFEIVVTDDGSSDDTSEIISSINDRRIKYYKFSENRGMYEAQRNCIDKSHGDYIVFLDSDDELVSNALQIFASNINVITDKVRIILADHLNYKTGRIQGNPKHFEGKSILTFDDIICKPFLGDFLPFVRRDVFDEVPYIVNSKFMTNLIWRKIFKKFSFYYLPVPLGIVHTEGADRRTSNRINNAKGWILGINDYINEFGEDIRYRCPSHLGFIYRILAMYQLLAGQRLSGLLSLKISLQYNPYSWKTWCLLSGIILPKTILWKLFR